MGKKKSDKEFIKNIDNEYSFLKENLNVVLGLMGFCTLVFWKSFDIFTEQVILTEVNQYFFISFIMACLGIITLGLTFFCFVLDEYLPYKKPLCSASFLLSMAALVLTVGFLVVQVLVILFDVNFFAKYFSLVFVPIFLIAGFALIWRKISRYSRIMLKR